MNLIRIEGTRAQLLGLTAIEGLVIARHSAEQVADDRFSVSAYAPDDVVPQIVAAGCEVNTITSSEEHEQLLAAMYEEIERDTGVA